MKGQDYLMQGRNEEGVFVRKVIWVINFNDTMYEEHMAVEAFKEKYKAVPTWVTPLNTKADLEIYNVTYKDLAKAIIVKKGKYLPWFGYKKEAA